MEGLGCLRLEGLDSESTAVSRRHGTPALVSCTAITLIKRVQKGAREKYFKGKREIEMSGELSEIVSSFKYLT